MLKLHADLYAFAKISKTKIYIHIHLL